MNVVNLLEQHNDYDLGGGLSIGRRPLIHAKWLIYFEGQEIHSRASKDLRRFDTVMDAVIYLNTASGLKALEEAAAGGREQ